MEPSSILVTLLSSYLSTFASGPPSLCDTPRLGVDGSPISDSAGRVLARYCQWAGPDVPVWDADVCCELDDDGATCVVPDAVGRCTTGESRHCEYGEAIAGGVVCYQPFPSACDMGLCVEAPDDLPPVGQAATLMCCGASGGCQHVDFVSGLACEGEILACNYGVSNEDGTVECLEPAE